MSSIPNILLSTLAITSYDFDPDATTATEIAWVDMRDFQGIVAQFVRTVGTGTLTMKIMANTVSNGSGTDVDVITKTFTAGQPDAVADYVFLEASRDLIAQKASEAGVEGVRYVTAVISTDAATDEGVVNYIRTPLHAEDALSADSIA